MAFIEGRDPEAKGEAVQDLNGSPFHQQPPQRRGIDAEGAGDLRPAFPFHDHAPGIIKLVRREFRRTAHMPPRRRAAAMHA